MRCAFRMIDVRKTPPNENQHRAHAVSLTRNAWKETRNNECSKVQKVKSSRAAGNIVQCDFLSLLDR